jgi:hypothetical protein
MIKVLVIGAGAIGAFYGALLAKAGAEVSVVCRSDYDQVKQYGFIIDSHPLGRWNFIPAQVLKNAADFKGAADYILLCTKVVPGLDRVALIRPAVAENTAIVFIQNGVEIEQEMRDAFPDNEVVSGLAFICCNRVSPGEILHLAYGRLALGNLPNGVSIKTAQLCELFNQSGIDCNPNENIVPDVGKNAFGTRRLIRYQCYLAACRRWTSCKPRSRLCVASCRKFAILPRPPDIPCQTILSTSTSNTPTRCLRIKPVCYWIMKTATRWRRKLFWVMLCAPLSD